MSHACATLSFLYGLRHNLSSQDLAYCFDVHASTISRILLKWLTLKDIQLRPLIMWPEREILGKQHRSALELSLETKLQ